jgi:hypothetical protein
MKSKLFVVAFVTITLIASFSGAFGIWPFWQSVTTEWLEKIGLPDGAAYVGEPDIRYEDGNQPEMLLQEIAIKGDPATVRRIFEQRCLAAGMSKPNADELQIEPTLICVSPRGRGTPWVMFEAVCEGANCRNFLEIHKIGL